jgi:hypothetical protein
MDDTLSKVVKINNDFQKSVSNLAFSHKNLMEETHDIMDLHKPSGYTGLTIRINIHHPDGKLEKQVGFVNGSNVFLPIRKSVGQDSISDTLDVRYQTEKDTPRKITLGNSLHILLDNSSGKPVLLYKESGVPDLGNLIHPERGDAGTSMTASKLAGKNVFVSDGFQDTEAKLVGCGYLPSDRDTWTKAGGRDTIESWSIGQCQTVANRAGAKSFMMGTNPWELNVFDSDSDQYKGSDKMSQVSGTYSCGDQGAAEATMRLIEGRNTLVVTTRNSPLTYDFEVRGRVATRGSVGDADRLMWPVFILGRFYLGALWENDGGRFVRVSKWCLMADGCSNALVDGCAVKESRLIASKTGTSPIGEYCGGNIFVLLTSTCYYKKDEETNLKQAGLPVAVPIVDASAPADSPAVFSFFHIHRNVMMDHDGRFHSEINWTNDWEMTRVEAIRYTSEFRCPEGGSFPCKDTAGECEYPNVCTEQGDQCDKMYDSNGEQVNSCFAPKDMLSGPVDRCPGKTCTPEQEGTLCGGSVRRESGWISGNGWVCKNGKWEDIPEDINSRTICTTGKAFHYSNDLSGGWGYCGEPPPRPEIYAELVLTDQGQIRIEQVEIADGNETRRQLLASKPMKGFQPNLLGPNELWLQPEGDGDGNTPILGGPTLSPMSTLRSGTVVERGKYLVSPGGTFRLLFGSVADEMHGDPLWDLGFLYGFGIVSGTPGEDRAERINNLLAGDEDANSRYDSCDADPHEPPGLQHLAGNSGIPNQGTAVVLQFTAPICGPRTDVKFDPDLNTYTLSATKTRRIIAHTGSSLEESSGVAAPKNVYPVASFAGSLFTNPQATNTALYNTVFVDEYSVPYVLGPEDVTYTGDFIFMGNYTTGMDNKIDCVDCMPPPDSDIEQAEVFIQKQIEDGYPGDEIVGFEYDPATNTVQLINRGIYASVDDDELPVELYPANVSLGGRTRLYLRKPLITMERADKLCNSSVYVAGSQDIAAQAGGPYLSTESIDRMPADKRCDTMVDLDGARAKFDKREAALMGDAKIIGEQVDRLEEDMEEMAEYKDASIKKINSDMETYEKYFRKVLAIIKNGTADAQLESSKLSLVNSNYEYVIWSILAISILMFVMSFKNR